MSNKIIRVTVAVEVPENADADQIALELRTANAGRKVQQYLNNIVVPSVVGVDTTEVADETLIHRCDWYVEDECAVCRRASSYSLQRTTRNYF